MNQTMFFFCRDSNFILLATVILLQIVMVSPGMHFVKNYESQSRTMYKMSQLRKQRIQLCLGLYVTRQLI